MRQSLNHSDSIKLAKKPYTEAAEDLTRNLSFMQLHQAHFIGVLPLLFTRYPSCLTSLVLESCPGAVQALRILREGGQLQLRNFRLRQENINTMLLSELKAFLESFYGLQHLSILLGTILGNPRALAFNQILHRHTLSLKSLV